MKKIAMAALALAWASPPAAADDAEEEWSVETSHAEVVEVDFETSEGTWMSVDVAPDGTTVVFDLLGHLYEMPIAGGDAGALTSGRSWNMFPRYSPDGGRIAFTSDRGGSDDVWVLDRATGELENVSDLADCVYRPTWSADGRRLFGTTLEDDAGSKALVFNLHGSHQELYGAAAFEPLSLLVDDPRRQRIYFEHLDGELYESGARIRIYDQKTGDTSVFLERPGGAFNPALSADGSRLAYLHRDDLETVLLVLDLDAGTERVVLRHLDRDRQESPYSPYGAYPSMAWHPNGSEILLSAGGKIVAVDAGTGATREIPFRARVERRLDRTLRFPAEIPETEASTRLHRWGQRTERGVLFEALGDLYLLEGSGPPRNLTSSPGHETSPVYDPATSTVYYASWTDDELGAVYALDLAGASPPVKLTSRPSQYGSLALSPDGAKLAYLRDLGELRRGQRLENETRFKLVVRGADGAEHEVTDVKWSANFAAKNPPAVSFAPDGEHLYFNEFESGDEDDDGEDGETLTLKRIRLDGLDEVTLYRFPNAVRAVVSPDLKWIAFREYQQSFVTPFDFVGKAVTVSAYDEEGTAFRVDPEDGAFLTWSADGASLAWTRGSAFYEKAVADILKEDGEGPRQTELSFRYDVEVPESTIALTNVRVVTMNPARDVLAGATVVVEGQKIVAVGRDLRAPLSAKVFDLAGHTIVPGFIDAHAHPETDASALNVIPQRPAGLQAALAHGVTTVYELYGNPSHKDFWISDMERAGAVVSPRLFSVGSPIFGQREFRPKLYRPISNLEEAHEAARYNRDHGATGLKDYVNFSRKTRHLLTAAARELGMNVYAESAGMPSMNFTQVIDGETGIEHSSGLTPLYSDVVRFLAASDVGVTPTLIVVYNGTSGEAAYHQSERLWESSKLLRFAKVEELVTLRRATHYWPDDLYAPEMSRAMKKLYDAGVSIQAGGHGQMLGLDMHWEMELLVEGGFSPHEALAAATIASARYHGLDRQVGSIEPGKLADLVVLRDDPLRDIFNTRAVRFVMKHGILMSGDDLARIYPDPRGGERMYFHPDH